MARNEMPSFADLIKALFTIAAVAAIAAMALGLFARTTGDSLLDLFQAMGSLDTAIIVALVTGLISIVTVVVGGIASNEQRRVQYLREHREQPYQKLIEMVYKMMAKSKNSESYEIEELLRDFDEFSRALTLWGSPQAIKLWTAWRLANVGRGPKPNPRELLFAMEGILFQLRRDMGQKRGLKKGDLLKMFINDVDEALL